MEISFAPFRGLLGFWWYPRLLGQQSEGSALTGIAKLRVDIGGGCEEAKVREDADERSRSSDRLPSMLLLSDVESEEFLDLPDIPPIGRLLLMMLFTS